MARRPGPGKPAKPARREPPPAPRRRGILARLFGLLPALVVGGLLLWVIAFFALAPSLPDTDELFADARQARVTLLAADGSVLAERGTSGQAYVRLGEISPFVVSAVLATEDRRFYSHFGLDLIGTARAMLRNLTAGGYVAGGSTLTQQLAKNLYLTPERSIRRKLQELILAIWLEARLDKDEILELYLNRVYLGAGAYGVEAAAQRYFGKPAARLDLAESAMIAGLLKAPSRYAPTNNEQLARERAATVLRLMHDAGYIDEKMMRDAQASPPTLTPGGGSDFAGYYVDWVLDGLTDQLGKPERGWVVRTTLDRKLQRAAEAAVARRLAGRSGVQAAIVVLDGTGAVRALVGGRTYRGSQRNRATENRRQPGSAFKSFVFLAALENGYGPTDRIAAGPLDIDGWKPRNGNVKVTGSIALDEAFARSINTATVRLSEEVGRGEVAETARRLGIASKLRLVPSLALGTSEVTPLELTAAYLPFATGGIRRPPFSVERVTDFGSKVLYAHEPVSARVMDEETARQMRYLLRAAVERGTGRAAALADRPAFGKTGTTQNNRDAWFVGFAGGYTAGVWLGRDDNASMEGINGANLPAAIWHDVMQAVPAPAPEVALGPPVPKPSQTTIADEAARIAADAAREGIGVLWRWAREKLDDVVP